MDSNGYNDSLFRTERCYDCGKQGDLVRHEVFHGPLRSKSKKYGCWMTLCPMCHERIHKYPKYYEWIKRETQLTAMERYGWSEEDFRHVFGKSWI